MGEVAVTYGGEAVSSLAAGSVVVVVAGGVVGSSSAERLSEAKRPPREAVADAPLPLRVFRGWRLVVLLLLLLRSLSVFWCFCSRWETGDIHHH